MARVILRTMIVLAAIGLGWAVGQAQTSEPEFEIVVDAPVGSTTITCVKGCKLAWVERGVNPNDTPMTTFRYECEGGTVRCSSGKVGGWASR